VHEILVIVGVVSGTVALKFCMEKLGRRDTVMLLTQVEYD